MNAKELTGAILIALKKEEDPIGILVEAVIENEFQRYESLLTDVKVELNNEAYDEEWADVLIGRINKVKQYVS
jgi:hypothetical protein